MPKVTSLYDSIEKMTKIEDGSSIVYAYNNAVYTVLESGFNGAMYWLKLSLGGNVTEHYLIKEHSKFWFVFDPEEFELNDRALLGETEAILIRKQLCFTVEPTKKFFVGELHKWEQANPNYCNWYDPITRRVYKLSTRSSFVKTFDHLGGTRIIDSVNHIMTDVNTKEEIQLDRSIDLRRFRPIHNNWMKNKAFIECADDVMWKWPEVRFEMGTLHGTFQIERLFLDGNWEPLKE
jgi:hypothetical protein